MCAALPPGGPAEPRAREDDRGRGRGFVARSTTCEVLHRDPVKQRVTGPRGRLDGRRAVPYGARETAGALGSRRFLISRGENPPRLLEPERPASDDVRHAGARPRRPNLPDMKKRTVRAEELRWSTTRATSACAWACPPTTPRSCRSTTRGPGRGAVRLVRRRLRRPRDRRRRGEGPGDARPQLRRIRLPRVRGQERTDPREVRARRRDLARVRDAGEEQGGSPRSTRWPSRGLRRWACTTAAGRCACVSASRRRARP